MEKVEFISARVSIALLSLFIWYIFVAIFPAFFSATSNELLGNIANVTLTIAIIQAIGLMAIWLSANKRFIVGTALNLLGLGTVLFYVIVTAPKGIS